MTTGLTDTVTNWTRLDATPDERQDYDRLITALNADFQPAPGYEVILTAEILRDTWRLRMYVNQIKQHADNQELVEALEKRRLRALTGMRRNTAELRRIQTERQLRTHLGDRMKGLGSTRELVEVSKLIRGYAPKATTAPDPAAVSAMESAIHLKLVREQHEMNKRTQPVGRNASCPCGSGQKFKRCCLQKAAAAA